MVASELLNSLSEKFGWADVQVLATYRGFQGFLQLALDNYNVGPIIPHTRGELTMEDVPTLQKMDAIVIAKPRKPFTNQEKVILDRR